MRKHHLIVKGTPDAVADVILTIEPSADLGVAVHHFSLKSEEDVRQFISTVAGVTHEDPALHPVCVITYLEPTLPWRTIRDIAQLSAATVWIGWPGPVPSPLMDFYEVLDADRSVLRQSLCAGASD